MNTKTILSNVSAIFECLYYNLYDRLASIYRPHYIILGTNDGALYVWNGYLESLPEKIYQFSSRKSIYQITANYYYTLVLLEDGSAYRFFNGTGDTDYIRKLRDIQIKLQPFSLGPKLIGTNIDHLFWLNSRTATMLMNDSTAYGLYEEKQDTIIQVRNLEYFEGENILDHHGTCLAINRFMSTASVYTLNLTDFTTWKRDTFSFEGNFMKKVGDYLHEHPVYCDDLDDEMVEQEEIMNSMLPKSMVRSVHDKRTYLDFVKLYGSGDKDNPFVVTGGRDHRIIITDFVSHKVFFDETFEDVPRCCCVGLEKIYVGCDNGTIVIINQSDYDYEIISAGDKRFKRIEAKGKYVVAVDSSDFIFFIDKETMEPIGVKIDEGVKDIIEQSWRKLIILLTESGDLLQIEI